jgi:phosphoserine phosphatase
VQVYQLRSGKDPGLTKPENKQTETEVTLQVIAVGDGANDIPMLKLAGLGVAT